MCLSNFSGGDNPPGSGRQHGNRRGESYGRQQAEGPTGWWQLYRGVDVWFVYVVWVLQHGKRGLFLTGLVLSLSDDVVVHSVSVYVGMY